MSTRMQTRLAKVETMLGNTGLYLYVTAAPADRCAEDVLRELGITLGERDEHVHLRRYFDTGPAELISANGLAHDRR